MAQPVYRFAPSPTGPLHFGSLVAAVAGYLDARAHGGRWLVRIEDVDLPRNVPGADVGILRCLEAFGFEWDGPVVYQTTRFDAYRTALDQLERSGLVYACACSRKEIGGERYPGTCRSGLGGRRPRAWRFRVSGGEVAFEDRIRGQQRERPSETCGDFVLCRADGIWAYQLAVVVDDAWQGVTDVVRGEDLLGSTARQIELQRALGFPTPLYAHFPVVLGPDGQKLSKQTKAPAVTPSHAAATLAAALRFLSQPTAPEMDGWPVGEVWQWAIGHWTHVKMKTEPAP